MEPMHAASTPGWLDAGCHGHVKKQCLLLWHGDINHIMMHLGADEAGGMRYWSYTL